MPHAFRNILPAFLGLCLLCAAAVTAADLEILKTGSWAVYKMDIRVEGVAAAATAAPAAPAGYPGLDPAMLAQLPPEKRAQIEAQMKMAYGAQPQRGGPAPGGQSMMQNAQTAVNDLVQGMNMRLRYAIVGEETRGGKALLWAEFSFQGQMPDIDKAFATFTAGLSPDQAKSVQAKAAEVKRNIQSLPIYCADGKLKMVTRMLIEKPDINAPEAGVSNPLEVYIKKGDHPPEAADPAAFAKAGPAAGVSAASGGAPWAGAAVRMFGFASQSLAAVPDFTQAMGASAPAGTDLGPQSGTVGMETVTVPVAGPVMCLHLQAADARQTADYWVSAFLPAFGIAKVSVTPRAKPASAYAPAPPKTLMEYSIESMGRSGAKPEIALTPEMIKAAAQLSARALAVPAEKQFRMRTFNVTAEGDTLDLAVQTHLCDSSDALLAGYFKKQGAASPVYLDFEILNDTIYFLVDVIGINVDKQIAENDNDQARKSLGVDLLANMMDPFLMKYLYGTQEGVLFRLYRVLVRDGADSSRARPLLNKDKFQVVLRLCDGDWKPLRTLREPWLAKKDYKNRPLPGKK